MLVTGRFYYISQSIFELTFHSARLESSIILDISPFYIEIRYCAENLYQCIRNEKQIFLLNVNFEWWIRYVATKLNALSSLYFTSFQVEIFTAFYCSPVSISIFKTKIMKNQCFSTQIYSSNTLLRYYFCVLITDLSV